MKRITLFIFLCYTLYLSGQIPSLDVRFRYIKEDNTIFQRDLKAEFRGLSDNFDEGFDEYMTDQQPSDLGLKTYEFPNQPLVVAAIEDFNQAIEIPLLLYLNKNRNVNFKITPNELPETNIYIRDDQEKQYYNVTGNAISIGLNLTEGNYLNRFFITFKIESLSLQQGYVLNEIQAYIHKNTNELIINKGNIALKSIALYTILGQEVQRIKDTNNSQIRVPLTAKESSIYILKIVTSTGLQLSQKLIY